jgi:hypothetical protein
MASSKDDDLKRCKVVAICSAPLEHETTTPAANLAALARLDAICFLCPNDTAPAPDAELPLPLPFCFSSASSCDSELTQDTVNEIYALCQMTPHELHGNQLTEVPVNKKVVRYAVRNTVLEELKADIVRAIKAEKISPLAISIPDDPTDAPLFGARLRYLRSTTAPLILLTGWEKVTAEKASQFLRLVEECARSSWAPPPSEVNEAALGQLIQEVGQLCASSKETDSTAATAVPFTGRKRWLHSLSNLLRSSPTLHRPVQKIYHRYRAATTPRKVVDGSTRPLTPIFEVDRRSNSAKTAVVVHAFYADLLSDLEKTLRHFTEPFDLYITTPHQQDIPLIERTLSRVTPNIVIVTTENRGRDIGPFLALFRTMAFSQYKAVLKLHLKKSLYSKQGDAWRNALYEELCPNGLSIHRAIHLLELGRVGIIGPHSFFLSHPRFWGANRPLVGALREAIGSAKVKSEDLGFFAGSMFWFRPDALRDIHRLPDSLLSFEPEAGHQDATLAHAFERVITEMAHNAGFVATSLTLDGEEICENTDLQNNSVPVLQ